MEVTISIRIDDAVHRRVKAEAALSALTIGAYIAAVHGAAVRRHETLDVPGISVGTLAVMEASLEPAEFAEEIACIRAEASDTTWTSEVAELDTPERAAARATREAKMAASPAVRAVNAQICKIRAEHGEAGE